MNTEKYLKLHEFFSKIGKKTAPENRKPKMEKRKPYVYGLINLISYLH